MRNQSSSRKKDCLNMMRNNKSWWQFFWRYWNDHLYVKSWSNLLLPWNQKILSRIQTSEVLNLDLWLVVFVYLKKFQYDEFLKIASQKWVMSLFQLIIRKIEQMRSLERVFLIERSLAYLQVDFLSHDQNFIGGFFVNKELMDTNIKKKSHKSKRLLYDKIGGGYLKISSFPIPI